MRDLHFLRTPISEDNRDDILEIEVSESPPEGNPAIADEYPQTLSISFEPDAGVTEVQIAPLWEGFFVFVPDSTAGNPTNPADVSRANYPGWSVTGDLILRNYARFVENSDIQTAFAQAIPLIDPVPSSVWYSKVVLTEEFLFTTLQSTPQFATFFNDELVTPDDPEYHEKFLINFLQGTAEMPCIVDANLQSDDTAYQPMPAILLAPSGSRTTLKIAMASSADTANDLDWFESVPEYDDSSGVALVDPSLQTEADLNNNRAHPAHSVISPLALYQSAKLVSWVADHDPSLPLRIALTAALASGEEYRRIDFGRPPIPGAPVGSAPSRHFPMYQFCWRTSDGVNTITESLRIPLQGKMYLPLGHGTYTFWAIPRTGDPTIDLEGDKVRVSTDAASPAKYIDVPDTSLTLDTTGLEEIPVYAHLQEYDSERTWHGFDTIGSERLRLKAIADSRWNATVLDWFLSPTDATREPFAPIYGYIRESAGRHGMAPEYLQTIVFGEGANVKINEIGTFDPEGEIDSFDFLGLDLILYRTGNLPSGLPLYPPEIDAVSDVDARDAEIAEYHYNLVTEGYVDADTASKVRWSGFEVENEAGRTLQIGTITGWAAAIELVAAELHARLDELRTYLSGQVPPVETVEDVQHRYLAYVRFNTKPDRAEELADEMSANLETGWPSSTRPTDQMNALYNTMQRIATCQWQEQSGIYRR